MYAPLGLLLQLLCFTSCGTPTATDAFTSVSADDYTFAYTLTEPTAVFDLDKDLVEISGLSLAPGAHYLAAVQDEDGIIFYIDYRNGKVKEAVDFWKEGDYEGLELVDNEIYVVKSTGTLYQVVEPNTELQEVTKYNDYLDGNADVEGLAYDAANNRLLLACKGVGTQLDTKSIYAFNLSTKKLETEPVFSISLDNIRAYLGTGPNVRKLDKLLEYFQPGKSELTFAPSGLAIHPITGEYYITSAVRNLLMVVSPDGEVKHLEKLKKSWFPQPEGITFTEDGTLFMSSEGRSSNPARLLRFDVQR